MLSPRPVGRPGVRPGSTPPAGCEIALWNVGLSSALVRTIFEPEEPAAITLAHSLRCGRLPFVAELDGILALGKPLGNPELVADQVGPGRGRELQLVLYPDGRQTLEEPLNTGRRFRCVISPV